MYSEKTPATPTYSSKQIWQQFIAQMSLVSARFFAILIPIETRLLQIGAPEWAE